MNERLFGRQAIRETLRAGRRPVMQLYVYDAARPGEVLNEILERADERGIPVHRVDNLRMRALVQRGNHQGIAAECGTYPYVDLDGLLAKAAEASEAPLLLLLDHLEDPQNFGSLLRTADAVGVDGTIIPRDRAVGVTPAVVKASAGASEHLGIAIVTNLARTLRELRQDGYLLVGLEGTPTAGLYTGEDLTDALALVVGSEGRGLKRLVRETCDTLIRVPMSGAVSSLNAGVAGALALYEVRRQRGERPDRACSNSSAV